MKNSVVNNQKTIEPKTVYGLGRNWGAISFRTVGGKYVIYRLGTIFQNDVIMKWENPWNKKKTKLDENKI